MRTEAAPEEAVRDSFSEASQRPTEEKLGITVGMTKLKAPPPCNIEPCGKQRAIMAGKSCVVKELLSSKGSSVEDAMLPRGLTLAGASVSSLPSGAFEQELVAPASNAGHEDEAIDLMR